MKNHLICYLFIFISFQSFGQTNSDSFTDTDVSFTTKFDSLVDNTLLPKKDFKSKYNGIVEFGIQSLQGESGINKLKLDMINGIQISPLFSVGFGTGVRIHEGYAYIPFYVDLRTNFNQNKVSPYFSFGIGHTVNATLDFEKAGLFANPTFGICIKNSKKSNTYLGIGFEFQKIKTYETTMTSYFNGFYTNYNINTIEYYKNTSAFCFNIGVSF